MNEEYITKKEEEKCYGKCKEFNTTSLPRFNSFMNRGVYLTRWELLLASIGISYIAREDFAKVFVEAGVYGNAILAVAVIFFLSRNGR
jgi:hypothetical protein